MFGHAWTLGIEEKYYIVWPLLFCLLATRRGAALLLPALFPLFLALGPESTRGYVAILAGSLGAMWVESGRGRAFILSTPTHVWAAAMAVGYAVATWSHVRSLGLLISLPAVGLIAALVNKDRDVYKSALSHALLVKVGGLTYAIYLIHRLVGNVVEIGFSRLHIEPSFIAHLALVYTLSVGAALLLGRFVEQPCIAPRRRLARSVQPPASNLAPLRG